MPIYIVTSTMQGSSNLPEDSTVNTTHWLGSSTPTDPENVFDMLDDFFGDVVTNYPDTTFTGDCLHQMYRLSDQLPRAVIESRASSYNPENAETLPREVVLVTSFAGLTESGTPAARRRGRLYLGTFTTGNTVGGRPSQDLRNSIAGATEALAEAAIAAVAWEWIVYSPTIFQETDDEGLASTVVRRGWVDDEWDTQRSRGWRSTERTTWGPIV